MCMFYSKGKGGIFMKKFLQIIFLIIIAVSHLQPIMIIF